MKVELYPMLWNQNINLLRTRLLLSQTFLTAPNGGPQSFLELQRVFILAHFDRIRISLFTIRSSERYMLLLRKLSSLCDGERDFWCLNSRWQHAGTAGYTHTHNNKNKTRAERCWRGTGHDRAEDQRGRYK